MLQPNLMPVPWRSVSAPASQPAFPFDRLDTSLTMLLGGLAGMLWGLATSIVEMFSLFGRRRSAALPSWIAAWSLIGLSLGWQAMFSVGLLGWPEYLVLAIQRIRGRNAILRNVAWLWCAYLLHLFSCPSTIDWRGGQAKTNRGGFTFWLSESLGSFSMLIEDDSDIGGATVPPSVLCEQSEAPEIDPEAIT